MPTIFTNAIANGVGTTDVEVYTAVEKSIVFGGSVSNLLSTTVPISIKTRRSSTDTYVYKNSRIEAGDPSAILQGNKIVLLPGDKLVVSSGVAASIDVFFSILQGVT